MKQNKPFIYLIIVMFANILSSNAIARHFTVINGAHYKMRIVAHLYHQTHRVWYCPAHHYCHIYHFPHKVRNVEISRFNNRNKFGYYPNRTTNIQHPFHNKTIRCENRWHRIACFNTH